jgi:hypothetical protein
MSVTGDVWAGEEPGLSPLTSLAAFVINESTAYGLFLIRFILSRKNWTFLLPHKHIVR